MTNKEDDAMEVAEDAIIVHSTGKIIFYSLLSGQVYTVDSDEVENLDQFQVPIKKEPDHSCKKCYGRGYIGFDVHKKYYKMCRCINKHIDRELASELGLK